MITTRIGHAVLALVLTAVAMPPVGANSEPSEPPSHTPWQELDHMPLPVFLAGISRSGRHAVVTGGITQAGLTAAVAQWFDLDNLRWCTINPNPKKTPSPPPRTTMPGKPQNLPPGSDLVAGTDFIALQVGRCMHAQVTLQDGRILIAGGQTGTAPSQLKSLASCELIDIEHHQATTAPPLPMAVRQPTAHRLTDGHVVVVGGSTASVLAPKGNQWVRHIGLRETRDAHASVLLPNETVLVIGGTHRRSLELVDPAGGTCRMLSVTLPHTTDDLRATMLPDGRVWVLGGQHSAGGDTVDRTWLIRVDSGEDSSISEGPRLGITRGVADHQVANLGRWCVVVGGESQRDGTDTELKMARLLDRCGLRVAPLPDTRWPHDDAAVLAVDHGLIVFGGFLMHTVSNAGKRKLRIPIVVAAVERLVLPDDPTLEATFTLPNTMQPH